MKKTALIIAGFVIVIVLAISSCRSSKSLCPAYDTSIEVEQTY